MKHRLKGTRSNVRPALVGLGCVPFAVVLWLVVSGWARVPAVLTDLLVAAALLRHGPQAVVDDVKEVGIGPLVVVVGFFVLLFGGMVAWSGGGADRYVGGAAVALASGLAAAGTGWGR